MYIDPNFGIIYGAGVWHKRQWKGRKTDEFVPVSKV